jgi:hypothetical protein
LPAAALVGAVPTPDALAGLGVVGLGADVTSADARPVVAVNGEATLLDVEAALTLLLPLLEPKAFAVRGAVTVVTAAVSLLIELALVLFNPVLGLHAPRDARHGSSAYCQLSKWETVDAVEARLELPRRGEQAGEIPPARACRVI